MRPGQGRIVEREYTPDDCAALGEAISALGEKTLDVYLNDRAYWRNVPATIWDYKLGGYQVLKKWLSYRERDVLGRALTLFEHLTKVIRDKDEENRKKKNVEKCLHPRVTNQSLDCLQTSRAKSTAKASNRARFQIVMPPYMAW